jgi:hypothetical protein
LARKKKVPDVTTPKLAPLTPWPYQAADIAAIVKSNGTALVVTEVGGGKTLVAIEAAKGINAKSIMVIAPQGTHMRGWKATIERQIPGAVVRKIDSSAPGKAALADLQWDKPGWYLCTPQWFARQTWTGFTPDYAIFDEIHVAGSYGNVTRAKLHQLQAKARLGMSGTPLRNKIENAWGIVRWLWPDMMPLTFWHWRMTLKTEFDRFAPQNRKVVGEHVPGQLMNSLPCYIQHMQREKCCKFHPKGFLEALEAPEEIVRTVQMGAKQKKFYKQMEDNYVAWLTTPDENGVLPVIAELPIVARGMLRFCALALPSINTETNKLYFEPDCESPKVDEVLQVLSEINEHSAIVYTHSQKFAAVLTQRLIDKGITAFEWSGKSTQKKRDAAMVRFIAGEIRVVVAQIGAVGTGTDGVQEATSYEIWVSLDDDPTNNVQARGRADRPGQKHRVTRIEIRSEGTYDDGIVSKQLETLLAVNAALKKEVA